MNIFYRGQTLGWDFQDLRKEEQQRQLLLPRLLQDFLLQYGCLAVNVGDSCCFHPARMRLIPATGLSSLPVMKVFGRLNENPQLAFFPAEADPQLYYVEREPDAVDAVEADEPVWRLSPTGSFLIEF